MRTPCNATGCQHVRVLLTISTTHRPATDLGYLLVKHPDRVQAFGVPAGTAHVCYPEASVERCTAALVLEVDPERLPRAGGRRGGGAPEGFTLGRFVNDRPYAASSLLAVALAQVFRSALRGEARDRPELAATPIPLELRIPVLRCRGGTDLAGRLFAPLGWTVEARPIPIEPDGVSPYVDLTLTGERRLADALNQLYVLLPVLDDAKHYWVAPDEVDKLIRAGTGWLAGHPERSLITRRYLAHRRALSAVAEEALDRLLAEEPGADSAADSDPDSDLDNAEDAELPQAARRLPLAAQRRRAVLDALAASGAARVLDLGCGGGALLGELVRDRRYTGIVGVDVSTRALEQAERRLRLDRLPERQRGRVRLWQSALTYRDDRLRGFDAAVLMEVVEHVDPPRLPAFAHAVFGHAAPATVIVTTPNVEYNARYEGLPAGRLRHHDHRFEWTRAEFAAWCAQVAGAHGYTVALGGAGEADPELGPPTQLAVFTRGATS
jgi:3' terminal RNA ribose 2'-O-methyltransferase Hen1